GPWIVSRALHVDFAASFLAFMALVNIHHFILDGALWKLRDSKIANLLLSGAGSDRQEADTSRAGFLARLTWIAGRSGAARVLRIGAAVLLLAWGAIDQLHFFYTSKATDTASLLRAAALNPDDSSVQLKLARADLAKGEVSDGLARLKQAVDVNPANVNLREE